MVTVEFPNEALDSQDELLSKVTHFMTEKTMLTLNSSSAATFSSATDVRAETEAGAGAAAETEAEPARANPAETNPVPQTDKENNKAFNSDFVTFPPSIYCGYIISAWNSCSQ
ncbi:MAG: hypothetical protein C5B49_13385 [Bdellovibrio sp.]|nr:MAG: hypothetical protein C5B49_13385 [Bdellovibrio sp.]